MLALLTVIVACLAPLQAQALEPASVDIGYFTDASRSLELGQILAMDGAEFVQHRRSDINFGYTRNAVWLRIAVESDRDRAVLLSLSPNFVDLIDIHVAEQRPALTTGDFHHIATGDHRPVPADGVSGLADMVELDLRGGETTLVYVRLAAIGSALTTDVQVYAKEEGALREAASTLTAGAWLGSMAILIVVQLVFFYYDRKPRYLLLALATLMAAIVYTGTLGLSRVFLFSDGGTGNDTFLAVSIWLGLTASTLAAISILDLRESSPWMNRLFLGFAVMGLVGAVCGILGLHLVFAPFGSMASILLATLGAFQALRTANAGENATRLRAAAYGVLWVGVIAVMTQRTAVIDLPNWVAHTYAIACVLQTILLTAALGVRLRAAENLNLVMQRQALRAARVAEEHANALVEERTRELAAARQTAEDALRAELASQQQQVRFMEVISHQYRTPLAAIHTHVDNIGLSLPRADETNRTRLDRVRKSIQRLVEVLEVNLSRARLQGPSFQPVLVRTPIAAVIEAAAARGHDLLQSTIVTETSSDIAGTRVRADADMLGVAIINLLENAVKFSRPKSREPVILSCRLDNGNAVVAVTDKGIGIPAAEIDGIFSATWRGSNVEGVDGSGMGLSLVARIAAAHGATVRAASVQGQGTTITISLPILPD